MTKDTDKLIDNLNEIKDDIINTISMGGSDTNRRLSQKLLELSAKDSDNAELYQLISLLNSNIDTDHIKFKKKAVEIVSKLITIKIEGLQLLKNISNSLEAISTKTDNIEIKVNRGISGFRIPYLGVIKIKDMVLFLLTTFLILFLAYHRDPIATTRAVNSIKTMNIGIQNKKERNGHE